MEEKIARCLDWLIELIKYYNLYQHQLLIFDIGLVNMLIINNDNTQIQKKLDNIFYFSLNITSMDINKSIKYLEYYRNNPNMDKYNVNEIGKDIFDILVSNMIHNTPCYNKYIEIYSSYRDIIDNLYSENEIDILIEQEDISLLFECLLYTSLKYICSKFITINIDNYNYLLDRLTKLDFDTFANNHFIKKAYLITHIIMNDTYHGCLIPRKEQTQLYQKCIDFFNNTKKKAKELDIDLYLEYEFCTKIIDNSYQIDYHYIYSLQFTNNKNNKLYYGSFNINKQPPNSHISLSSVELGERLYNYTHMSQLCLLLLNYKQPGKMDRILENYKIKNSFLI